MLKKHYGGRRRAERREGSTSEVSPPAPSPASTSLLTHTFVRPLSVDYCNSCKSLHTYLLTIPPISYGHSSDPPETQWALLVFQTDCLLTEENSSVPEWAQEAIDL